MMEGFQRKCDNLIHISKDRLGCGKANAPQKAKVVAVSPDYFNKPGKRVIVELTKVMAVGTGRSRQI